MSHSNTIVWDLRSAKSCAPRSTGCCRSAPRFLALSVERRSGPEALRNRYHMFQMLHFFEMSNTDFFWSHNFVPMPTSACALTFCVFDRHTGNADEPWAYPLYLPRSGRECYGTGGTGGSRCQDSLGEHAQRRPLVRTPFFPSMNHNLDLSRDALNIINLILFVLSLRYCIFDFLFGICSEGLSDNICPFVFRLSRAIFLKAADLLATKYRSEVKCHFCHDTRLFIDYFWLCILLVCIYDYLSHYKHDWLSQLHSSKGVWPSFLTNYFFSFRGNNR